MSHSFIMQAFTSESDSEVERCVEMLMATDAGTGFMHESFHPDRPGEFSRPWFAWANSLFAVLMLRSMGFPSASAVAVMER